MDYDAECEMECMQDIITKVRGIRAENKIDPKQKVEMDFYEEKPGRVEVLEKPSIGGPLNNHLNTVMRLALLSNVIPENGPLDPAGGPVRSGPQYELRIRYGSGTNVADEITRLRKDLERLTKDIASKQQRLQDETFRSRAPEHIVKGVETTLGERRPEFDKVGERLTQLERNLGTSA